MNLCKLQARCLSTLCKCLLSAQLQWVNGWNEPTKRTKQKKIFFFFFWKKNSKTKLKLKVSIKEGYASGIFMGSVFIFVRPKKRKNSLFQFIFVCWFVRHCTRTVYHTICDFFPVFVFQSAKFAHDYPAALFSMCMAP